MSRLSPHANVCMMHAVSNTRVIGHHWKLYCLGKNVTTVTVWYGKDVIRLGIAMPEVCISLFYQSNGICYYIQADRSMIWDIEKDELVAANINHSCFCNAFYDFSKYCDYKEVHDGIPYNNGGL